VRLSLLAAFAGLLLTTAPGRAENTLPPVFAQQQLVKATMLTFNDANMTGNYSVLHARMGKAARDTFSEAQMQQTFKVFADPRRNLMFTAVMTPVINTAKIDESGVLHLAGYFEGKPRNLNFEFNFAMSENEWKPVLIGVNSKLPGE